jgi:uncharacterized membrane protein YebE (DUF533 family)
MNDVTTQQALGAIRTLLGVAAGFLIGKGYVDATTATTVIGAIMVLIPLAWSAWDKHHSEQVTQAREAVAMNVGIAVADRTAGVTPAVQAEHVPAVIKAFASAAVVPGVAVSPSSPIIAESVPAVQAAAPASKLPFGVARP